MTSTDRKAPRLTISSIINWIRQGWASLMKSFSVSLLYASVFVLIGVIVQWSLLSNGYLLVHYLFAGGFLLLLPPLLVVYYQIISDQIDGNPVTTGTLFRAFRNTPLTVWGLNVIGGILYLIWITDALIIYTVYFALDPIQMESHTQNLQLRTDIGEFLFHVSLLGLLLSLIAFFITAFAVPKAYYHKAGFVDAVVYSIKTIIRNFRIMVIWALIVGGSQLIALLLFPPAELILLPLFAYANYYAFQDTLDA